MEFKDQPRKRQLLVEEVLLERARQIDQKGFSHEHDCTHTGGQLAQAAACYASTETLYKVRTAERGFVFTDAYPWGTTEVAKKNKARRRQLIVSAALILAELERLEGVE